MKPSLPTRVSDEVLIQLTYELLDAHDDTARIVGDGRLDPVWKSHIDYLRALQRKGRELLAQSTLEPSP
jgi:hypothetical protein